MCGIVGFASLRLECDAAYRNKIQEKTGNVLNLMKLRGPDDNGTASGKNWIFGHTRLSILDLAAGAQPWHDEKSGAVITYNGEIFNYIEIKDILKSKGYTFKTHCDTEVLLASYLEWGEECLEKLNGFFAFAIHDPAKNIIFAARDRLGVKPFFYSLHDGSDFSFCSTVAGLISFSDNKPEPQMDAVSHYLTTGRNSFGEKTLLKNIFTLRPGHCIRLDLKSMVHSVRRYWKRPVVKADKKEKISFEEASGKVKELVEDAVRKRLISDVPVGAFLSGGLDSAVICTVADRYSSYKLPLFCAGTDDEKSNEFVFAEMIAAKLGVELKKVVLDAGKFSENWGLLTSLKGLPLCTPNEISIYKLAEALRKECTVTLTGEGADEIFGGYTLPHFSAYDYDRCARSPETADTSSPFAMAMLMRHGRSFFINDTDHYTATDSWMNFNEKSRIFNAEVWDGIDEDGGLFAFYEDFFAELDGCSTFDKRMHLHAEFNLENLLSRIDNSTMAASVEARVPFTDYRIAELLFTLPDEYKMSWLNPDAEKKGRELPCQEIDKMGLIETKRLLRNAYRNELPDEIVQRKKMSFPVPFNKWFYGPLFEEVKELCLDSAFTGEYFNKNTVEKLVASPDKNMWLVSNLCRWWNIVGK